MGLSEIASNRNRKSEDILPFVERFFLQVSERMRSRQVNRSASDIPVRVAAVDSTSLQSTMQNPEFRDGVIYSVIRSNGFTEAGCVMMQYSLVSRLLEKAYGGEGDVYESQVQVRHLPPGTRKFVQRLLSEMLQDIQHYLVGRRKFKFDYSEPTVNEPNWDPQARNAEVFAATIDIGPLAQPYGLMSIVLPIRLFEMMFGVRASKPEEETEDEEENSLENSRVLQLPVDVVAELDRFPMSLAEVREMMVGDFIPLNENMQVSLRVNNQQKFVGEFGEVSGFRAVRIEERISDDE